VVNQRVRPTPSTNSRGIALIAAAHVTDDLYQGVIPAMLPFLVAERHYSYAAVAGLVLAGTILSSVAQPLFGWWADRRSGRWLVTAGMLTAGIGVALSGLATAYAVTGVALALSGLGVAAFHPEAARAARQAAGNSTRAMSVFAVGGNAGYALGPILATPVLVAFGLRGTVLLILPAAVMAVVLLTRLTSTLDGTPEHRRTRTLPTGEDDWRAFSWLTGIVVSRSILFFGITTFVALYFAHSLGASRSVSAAALTAFLVAGAAGTLLGGVVADRTGKLVSIRVGFALMLPALGGLVLASDVVVAMGFVVVAGVAAFLPFSVFVMLGQDYLPRRIGTASGVTVGLAVSVGGLVAPMLGILADATSLRTALAVLLVLPVVALALSSRLHEPRPGDSREPATL
jgi:FSR family fosmidomycin resistance protein-like MFS transporter